MHGSVIHADFSTLTGEESDDYLVRRFQNGDKGAFQLLVERHQERVRNLINSIFQDSDIVDDLAQDVFIRLYEALDRFRFESSLSTFLYRIAVSRSRDDQRRRLAPAVASMPVMTAVLDAGPSMPPDHGAYSNEFNRPHT